MPILTIESTCDETAAAVICDDGSVLGECVATQETLHEQFGGVVPEVAARAHVERILPVIDTALRKAELQGADLDAIAVADRPGLAGSLLVGVVAAKTLAVAWKKPLVAINHLHAHLYACQMASDVSVYPCIGLVVSGGHTSLYHCTSPLDLEYLGGTIDDAAGEAFDKVGAMLNLGFPGGPAVSRLAAQGDPKAHAYPRSMLKEPGYRFSFSGLKTAVRYSIAPPGVKDFSDINLSDQAKADICASFQAAVVDVLVAKSVRAVKAYEAGFLIVGGGVAANPVLRTGMQTAAEQNGFQLVIAPMNLCTDNAVMGAIALEKMRRGQFAPLDLDITAGLQRGF
ncbi:tRNA (adenosine(37)-N6)-threonylcarbamoyltransferase complex transferase subunit TsaD [Stieleria sp. ICT_E10.1]|uniref:tRNA (adenosine(37)-N6)-threonylcarbamoyltransferase complex transferase subunit TsaD n=1 Tax=Stieleria sedimenti TaxID=2976331 RepID=UPI0021807CA7|nr:tRNA (adenosine(37)-N6)-threonylcarbamoyltransferase complex transferase subunit TsaD [Stieleria sedimenti]MCS7470046.1 tRNA (adenosine(37)-N6)-threonylcarbamoyltransferase complex transferase subunit TsaD [Stieleria sedimenti]